MTLHPTHRWLASLVLTLSAIGCSSKTTAPPYINSELGIEVDDTDTSDTQVTFNADGSYSYNIDDEVNIDGMGMHPVVISEDDQPAAMGGKETLSIMDMTMGQSTTYGFDPTMNGITVINGMGTVAVVQNPDHSYSVGGQPAANGKAAVALLKANPAYTGASPFGLLAAYSLAQTPAPVASRGCGSGPFAPGVSCTTAVASPPTVCSVFKDLCDCAACDKVGKASCALCP